MVQARWWHALLFWGLVNAYGLLVRSKGPPFAGYVVSPLQPPAWVFPVVWFSLNVVQLWGCVRLLNRRAGIRHWRVLVALQLVLWALYATFTYVYFTLGSPVLAMVWTMLFCVLSVIGVALVWKDDRRIAVLWMPQILWTSFASIVAAQQVRLNPDPFLGIG